MAVLTTCVEFWTTRMCWYWEILIHKVFILVLISSCFIQAQIPQKTVCDSSITQTNDLVLTESPGTAECACKITRNGPYTVIFTVKNFTCDYENGSWKFKVWKNGCEREELDCKSNLFNNEHEFKILSDDPASKIYLQLYKYQPLSQWVYYEVHFTAQLELDSGLDPTLFNEMIAIKCGFDLAAIEPKEYEQCLTTPGPTTTTTTTTTTSTTISSTSQVSPVISPSMTTAVILTSSTEQIDTTTVNADGDDSGPFLTTGILIGIIAGAVFVLAVFVILIVVVAASRRRHDKRPQLVEENDEDSQSQYSYTRELPGSNTKKKQINDDSSSKTRKLSQDNSPAAIIPNGHLNNYQEKHDPGSKTLPGPAIYVTDSWWSEKQNGREKVKENTANTLPMTDVYAKSSKQDKHKSVGQKSITSPDGDAQYAYLNRIVDDEFSFINNDLYSGHLGF